MPQTHYTTDNVTPLCGWHRVHLDQPYRISGILSMDTCDLCMYIWWRKNSHSDILEYLPKCRATVRPLWVDESEVYICCDIPSILHEDVPEDEQIHWDFHMGYWIGQDCDSVVFV